MTQATQNSTSEFFQTIKESIPYLAKFPISNYEADPSKQIEKLLYLAKAVIYFKFNSPDSEENGRIWNQCDEVRWKLLNEAYDRGAGSAIHSEIEDYHEKERAGYDSRKACEQERCEILARINELKPLSAKTTSNISPAAAKEGSRTDIVQV